LDTSVAGARSGTVTVNYASNGAGSSNLGITQLTSQTQTITVSGNVYKAAAGAIQTAALNFGTVQVGQVVTQNLVIANTATGAAGFVEDLNASFGSASGTGASLISGTGALNGILAGTNSTAGNGTMTVNVNTGAVGTVNGSIAVNYTTAGAVNGVSNGLGTAPVGSDPYGVVGTIQTNGNIINQASPLINTPTLALGNVRVGAASPTQFVSVSNVATTAPQAALDASISTTAPLTASGSFTLLNPGATNNTSLQVGMNTATAGSRNGTATVALVSDANNVGGCGSNCLLTLASQNVNITGAVYRLANPTLNTPNVTLVARVGDTAPTAVVSITNTSPDQYTEGLKVSGFTTAAPGFTTSGSIANLAAQATNSTALTAALKTTAAGTFLGQGTLALVSTGAGTDNAADLALASQTVNLSGKVYTAAQAQVSPTPVNFGYVHVGDTITTQNVTVANTAAVTALNDVLNGTLSGLTGPFSASGSVSGVTAGSSTHLGFGLSTAAAGTFNSAATLALSSHDADQADLSLGSTPIALSATVNYHAAPVFELGAGGIGTLSNTGTAYVLNLGNITQGTALDEMLALLNGAAGQSDLLEGGFGSSGTGLPVTFGGFGNFTGLANGQFVTGDALFNTTNLGSIDELLTFTGTGYNPDFQEGLGATLLIEGSVVSAITSVPEPDSLPLTLLAGGLMAASTMLRRRRPAPTSLRA
jgi:hypothetical protein